MSRAMISEEVLALAKSGDAEAQYAISSALHQRGQMAESVHWLTLAAAQQLVPAQLTLAVLLIDGRHCARDRDRAIGILEPLAGKHIQADLLLSELHGFAALGGDDRVTAVRYLVAAARMGDPASRRQLAVLSLCHGRDELVRPLLDGASRSGDAAASYLLAYCLAHGVAGPSEPGRARAMLRETAAQSQYLHRQLQIDLGVQDPVRATARSEPLPIDWRAVQDASAYLGADIPLPQAEVLHEAPLIRRLPEVIHPLALDALINLAAPLVRRSQIVDARTGAVRADPMRTSWHMTIGPRQHDHVLETIERCIGRVTGLPSLNGEFLQILRYRQGEEYRLHVDYFNESGVDFHRAIADGGQRAQTALVYLNEGYGEGCTRFPRLNIEVKGRRGDMLHFRNLDENAVGCKDTLHAGAPVVTGEKWVLSQWIRSERYPPRLAW